MSVIVTMTCPLSAIIKSCATRVDLLRELGDIILKDDPFSINTEVPPLIIASQHVKDNTAREVFEYLINHGANVEDTADLHNEYDSINALRFLIPRNQIEGIKFLIEKGINIDATWELNKFSGWCPITLAIECHSPKILKLLIDHGADLSLPGAADHSPLHFLLLSEVQSHQCQTVTRIYDTMFNILIDSGVDLNRIGQRVWIPGSDTFINVSPLQYAIELGLKHRIEKLIRIGADTSIKTEDGESIVDIADPKLKNWLEHILVDAFKTPALRPETIHDRIIDFDIRLKVVETMVRDMITLAPGTERVAELRKEFYELANGHDDDIDIPISDSDESVYTTDEE